MRQNSTGMPLDAQLGRNGRTSAPPPPAACRARRRLLQLFRRTGECARRRQILFAGRTENKSRVTARGPSEAVRLLRVLVKLRRSARVSIRWRAGRPRARSFLALLELGRCAAREEARDLLVELPHARAVGVGAPGHRAEGERLAALDAETDEASCRGITRRRAGRAFRRRARATRSRSRRPARQRGQRVIRERDSSGTGREHRAALDAPRRTAGTGLRGGSASSRRAPGRRLTARGRSLRDDAGSRCSGRSTSRRSPAHVHGTAAPRSSAVPIVGSGSATADRGLLDRGSGTRGLVLVALAHLVQTTRWRSTFFWSGGAARGARRRARSENLGGPTSSACRPRW